MFLVVEVTIASGDEGISWTKFATLPDFFLLLHHMSKKLEGRWVKRKGHEGGLVPRYFKKKSGWSWAYALPEKED